MKYFFVSAALIIFISTTFSQTARYRDSIFSAIDTSTVVFGANLDYQDVMDTLRADIYQPQQDDDAARAMIIYVHGGGFVKGTRNDSSIQALCRKLTARGYVTASIDYRIGISDHQQVSGLINASLRAVQDLNAFIRYAKTNAAQLKIDTNKIFIAGSSAGGITVMLKAFIKMDSIAEKLGITSMSQLEGNTNNLSSTTNVAGVFAMWGAVYDTSWIQKGDLPIGLAHSRADSTMPFNISTNKKNRSFLFYGSLPVYNRAQRQGLLTSLHVYESRKHDLGLKEWPYSDTTAQLIIDFFYKVMHPEIKEGSFESKTFLLIENLENNFLVPGLYFTNEAFVAPCPDDSRGSHSCTAKSLFSKTMSGEYLNELPHLYSAKTFYS